MSAAAEMRRGWCPSAARPMPTGDGLLVRLGMPGGSVPLALARGIASCARRYGNGLIDLTRRGNLQLRGVREATLPALLEALASFEIPAWTHETEVARDILMSPLAGIDPKAVCDILPVAAALRERLPTDRRLRALPAKFCFLIDDGGRLGLDDIDADIRFKARHSESGPVFTVGLGGQEGKAATLGACAVTDVADVAARLANAFLNLRAEGEEVPRRMARLLETRGVQAILRCAGLGRDFIPLAALPPIGPPPEQLQKPPIGSDMTCENAVLGFGVAFGRLTADQLEVIADGVEEVGGGLRLTPWRVILIVVRGWEQEGKLDFRFEQSGLMYAASDARLSMAACPGMPLCSRATVTAQEDALKLGRLAQGLSLRGIGLHVSGCAKGCASSNAAKVTLVGRDGHYDLVRDGIASDPPLRTGLTVEAAQAVIAEIVDELWADFLRKNPKYFGEEDDQVR